MVKKKYSKQSKILLKRDLIIILWEIENYWIWNNIKKKQSVKNKLNIDYYERAFYISWFYIYIWLKINMDLILRLLKKKKFFYTFSIFVIIILLIIIFITEDTGLDPFIYFNF